MKTEIKLNLPKVLKKGFNTKPKLISIIQASYYITEADYVKEVPVDSGDFRLGLKVVNQKEGYKVASTAKSVKNYNYPLALYMGTGRLKKTADQGYTSGRVRSNTVAFGIGGIRPNKAAKRAKEKAEPKVVKFVNREIANLIKQK
jgi:hypothetical protein